jgi:tetratricopeptide (TPR) repeat protein
MPAHIFQRLGRYADAAEANRHAIEVDAAYFAKVKPPGYYPKYQGHNYGFLAFSAAMLGRAEESLRAARVTARAIPAEMMAMMPGMDFFAAEPLVVMVRFGRWDELLTEPRPAEKYPVLYGFWLHGHGMALAAKGKLPEAKADLATLQQLSTTVAEDLTAGHNRARVVLALGAKILEARLATIEKKPGALALWSEAVALEDGLSYAEPANWFYPVRHLAGAALLAAGKAKDAEAVFREDLRRNPANGWGSFGLWKALAAQGRKRDAAAAQADFERAWQNADIKLTAPAF